MWRALDETCRRGVAEGAFPGAVALVGNSRDALFHRAYGCRALAPERLPMEPDTVFDLSSLTKSVATATAMMLLVRDERLRLDDPVCAVIPEFSRGARAEVTFRQLLNHTSGLPAWKPYYESAIPGSDPVVPGSAADMAGSDPVIPGTHPVIPGTHPVIPAKAGIQGRRGATERAGATGHTTAGGRNRCLEQLHDEELVAPPGETHLYSDLGFILLGEAVERLGGKSLDRFCHDEIFGPMGLSSTFFVDLNSPGSGRSAGRTLAATEDCPWRGKVLCGEVHDDNAWAMGGVAGHAGVFSPASDVHRFIRFLGRCLDGAEREFLPAPVVREFLEAERTLPGQTHVLGWDTPSPEGSSSGRHFSSRTVGHLGYTGTSIWWDLERDVHVVFLTNRVHPSRNNPAIREFRPLVHDAAMQGLPA